MIGSVFRKAEVLFELLGPRLVLDALILTVALYAIYRIVRASGSWKIVVGLAVAAALLAAADLLRLQGVLWVYNHISRIVLISLVVVFQPEIRKFLERAATMRRARPRGPDPATDVVVEAAFACAKKRWGALFVFPGADPIGRWISGGIEVGGDASVPLLLSIFDPHSPGHDGAVVVGNGKVLKMAVRLPLSEGGALSSAFGTRHHAALGLSERTDALVVVVSEERGTVRVFEGGRGREVRSPDELAAAIAAHAKKTGRLLPAEGGGFRKELLPIAACALVAFWIAARAAWEASQIVERPVEYAVEYAVPKGLALLGEKPSVVTAYLAGAAADLAKAEGRDRTIRVDLADAPPGRKTVVLREEQLALPRGVRLLALEPPALDLVLTRVEERELPVRPNLTGAPPPGVAIERVEVAPPVLRVLVAPGDERGETATPFLSTTPIPLEGIRATARFSAQVVAPPHILPAGRRFPELEVLVVVSGGA